MSSSVKSPYYLQWVGSTFFDQWLEQITHRIADASDELSVAVSLGRLDLIRLSAAGGWDVVEASHAALADLRSTNGEFRYGLLERRLDAWINLRRLVGPELLSDEQNDYEPCQITAASGAWQGHAYLFGVILWALQQAGLIDYGRLRRLAGSREIDIREGRRDADLGWLGAVVREVLDGGSGYPVSWWPSAPVPEYDEVGSLINLVEILPGNAGSLRAGLQYRSPNQS